MKLAGRVLLLLVAAPAVRAFVPKRSQRWETQLQSSKTTANEELLLIQKKKLLELIGKKSSRDPVLADPITKESIEITVPGVLLGGESRRSSVQYKIQSPSNTFQGSSDTFLDLLEPAAKNDFSTSSSSSSPLTGILQQAFPMVPFFLRQPLASLSDGEYIPMRDLFTSPAVSFAYERGWRQAFAQAGFPGADVESRMAMDYFAPVVAKAGPTNSVVVDMSCATGEFFLSFELLVSESAYRYIPVQHKGIGRLLCF
jgi:hypothetical protein